MPDILLRDKLWGPLSWGKLSSFFFGRFGPNVFRPLGVGVTLLNPTQVHGSYFPYPTLLDNTYPLLPYSLTLFHPNDFFPCPRLPNNTYPPLLYPRATEILKSKSVRSTDDVIGTCVRQSQTVMKTNDSSFSYKSVSEIDYLSNTTCM